MRRLRREGRKRRERIEDKAILNLFSELMLIFEKAIFFFNIRKKIYVVLYLK